MAVPILAINNLKTAFNTEKGQVTAVDGVSLSIKPGEILGLVGESGSGKSVTSLSVMQLIPNPPGRIVGGEILFRGEDLLRKSPEEIRKIRGNRISMIFQEPMTSLNPVYTVGDQLVEAFVTHKKIKHQEALLKAIKMLDMVGIPSPDKRINSYPHQFSGGMRQRVMISMALACDPELLIADEPTTALDVTIQAQILDLLREINKRLNTSILLVTHDLGIVAGMCHRVCVMYAGKVVESADIYTIFERPAHPYTEALLRSIPTLEEGRQRLRTIEGVLPNPLAIPPGCRFAPRCKYANTICREQEPEYALLSGAEDHYVSCWNPNGLRKGGVQK